MHDKKGLIRHEVFEQVFSRSCIRRHRSFAGGLQQQGGKKGEHLPPPPQVSAVTVHEGRVPITYEFPESAAKLSEISYRLSVRIQHCITRLADLYHGYLQYPWPLRKKQLAPYNNCVAFPVLFTRQGP